VALPNHDPITGNDWTSFEQMNGQSDFIQSLACAPKLEMPHAQVPWRRFWQQNLSATLASELAFPPPGCPPS
jgi:hypothetical protein